jgi:hypothetical protein
MAPLPRLSASIGALALLAALGCSSDPDAMTEDQFCVELARRECEKIGVVCGRNEAQCQSVRTDVCRKDASAARQVNRTFRADNADGCLASVSATYDNKLIRAENWSALHAACGRVFEGHATTNQTCAADADCAAPLVCDKHLCGNPTQVASGSGCANAGERCPADEYCRPGAGFATCTKRLDRGVACSAAEPCRAELRCLATCMDRMAEGNACTADEDCVSGYCNAYPRAGSPRTCTMGLSFGTDSPSCDAYFGVTVVPVDAAVPDAAVASPDAGSADAAAVD